MGTRLVTAMMAALAMACSGGGSGDDDAPAIDAPAIDAPAIDAPVVDAPDIDAATIDAPVDAGGDANPGVCDPLAPVGQQGCITGQKCTWIRTQAQPVPLGRLGCVPDGSVAIDGACTQGPVGQTTGYDNCAAGGICINAVCKDICGFDGSQYAACAQGFNCARYANMFANGSDDPIAGACNRACDPITQLQSNGVSCGPNMGCYILTNSMGTITTCAGAGNVMPRQEIVGTAYANSCIPGAQPRRRDSSTMVQECGGLCRPTDVTSTLNMASEGGVTPDSCQQRWGMPAPGDANGESCRYWWARETITPASSWGNTVGWCFRHGAHLYDSNMDNVVDRAFPRCVNLTTGDVEPPVANPPHNDAMYFWCVAAPQMLTGAVHDIRRWRATREPRLDMLAPPY